MNFDKDLVAGKLRRWEKYLEDYKLPGWDDIPNIGLYMEQVIILLKEYLDYLSAKLETFKAHNVHMEFEIVQDGIMHRHALLVTNQQAPEGPIGFVVDFNDEGKVKMLDITLSDFF